MVEKDVSELLSDSNKLKNKQNLAFNFVKRQTSILDTTWYKLRKIISETEI